MCGGSSGHHHSIAYSKTVEAAQRRVQRLAVPRLPESATTTTGRTGSGRVAKRPRCVGQIAMSIRTPIRELNATPLWGGMSSSLAMIDAPERRPKGRVPPPPAVGGAPRERSP